MSDMEKYLRMQQDFYEQEAAKWSCGNRDPVVGNYDKHNAWKDYDQFLFKDFDTNGLVALEYGCGPGRNIIRFHDRFERIDGTDISEMNLMKAQENLVHHNVLGSWLVHCDGKGIPFEENVYDVVFSVICLQHICVHEIRFAIMKDVYRVLKPGGHFCFQMGFGGRTPAAGYYENIYDAQETNGGYDVAFNDETFLKDDLEKIGFKNYKSDVRPTGPGDSHPNWIFVQVEK